MIRKLFILTAMCLSFTIIRAQENINFDKLMQNNKITVVYISGSMVNMIPTSIMDSDDMEEIELSKLVDKMEGFYIFSSEDPIGIKEIKSTFTPVSGGNIKPEDMLMYVKDDNSKVSIYSPKTKSGKNGLLMLVDDSDSSYVAIYLKGHFNENDINTVIKKGNSKQNKK